MENIEENKQEQSPVDEKPKARMGRPPKEEKPKVEYATQEQFGELMSAVQGLAEIIQDMKSPTAPSIKVDTAAPIGDIDNPGIPVNPAWRKIVDEVLGADFGIQVEYSENGDSIKFTVVVPPDKSNVRPDYKDYYKHDWRTIALNPAQTGVGIRQWCERIKRNLGRSQIM